MAKPKQEKRQIQHKVNNSSAHYLNATQWYGLIIFLFSFLIYFNSVFNDYNLDDELVTQNHRLTSKGIAAIPEIFSSPYYEDQAGYKYEYRPMVLVTFAIEHSFFGDNPQVNHFVNVLLYSLLCLLLFVVLRELLAAFSPLLPLLIVLLFAAHPIHSEVVASIKNRDELLAFLFGLLSLFFALRFHSSKNFLYLILIPIFFLLGILSKSTTITFVLLLPFCLLMFTDITLLRLLLITALLSLPAILFSRLYSLAQLVLLLIGVFGTVIILYYLKASDFLLTGRKSFSLWLEGGTADSGNEQTSTVSLHFGFLKNKFFAIALVLFVLLVSGLCFSGIAMGNLWLTLLPLFALVLAFLFSRDEIKVILLSPISLITIYALTRFQQHTSLIETGLIVLLVGQILSGNKVFRITGIINYAIYAVVSIIFLHSNFFLAVLFFAGFLNRKLYPLVVGAAVLSLIVIGKHVFDISSGRKAFSLAYFSLPLIYTAVFLFWKNRQLFLSRASVMAIPLGILLYYLVSPLPVNHKVIVGVKNSFYGANAIKAPDVTPVSAVRPLKYIEYPIDNKNDPMDIKLGTAMLILGNYLKLVIIPYPMSYYYGYAYIVPTSLWNIVPLALLVIHLFLALTGLYFIRKNPLLAFGILFYLFSISAFSNLLMPIPGLLGDRFLLIPSLGFCLAMAALLSWIFKQKFTDSKLRLATLSSALKISFAGILVLYSLVTVSRNSDWRNRITLFRHDIGVVEKSAQAQNLLGLHLFLESNKLTDLQKQRAMREEAVVHLRKAVEIYPQFLNASFDLGRVYEAMQMPDSAFTAYERTIHLDPTFVAPCFGMGIIEQNRGHLDKAIPLYEKFLTKYPTQIEGYANLSYAHFMRGQYDSSIAVNRRALHYLPNQYEVHINLSKTFLAMGQRDSARYYALTAGAIRPNDPTARYLLQQVGN